MESNKQPLAAPFTPKAIYSIIANEPMVLSQKHETQNTANETHEFNFEYAKTRMKQVPILTYLCGVEMSTGCMHFMAAYTIISHSSNVI